MITRHRGASLWAALLAAVAMVVGLTSAAAYGRTEDGGRAGDGRWGAAAQVLTWKAGDPIDRYLEFILADPSDANGGRHTAEVTLTPGRYLFTCTIPGHGRPDAGHPHRHRGHRRGHHRAGDDGEGRGRP